MASDLSIYMIAPSSPPKNKKWLKGVDILKSLGFKLYHHPHWLKPDFLHANNDHKRSLFLKQAFSSKSCSIVWMLRGGYGFQKLIPSFKKDYLKIKKHKKLFIGYSDGTAMHLFLNNKNWKTLHAPTISELADLSSQELTSLKQVLLDKKPSVVFNRLQSFKHYSNKKLKGKIWGGNLTLLASSIGTQSFPAFDFLFIEDTGEPIYKIDRYLHQLLYAGYLKSVKAILFGNFDSLTKKSFYVLLKNFSKVCSADLIFNLPCGHKNKKPLPLNTLAKLSIEGSRTFLEVKNPL